MRKFSAFLASNKGKKFLNFAYSFGASIVILGAMFKLLHLKFADIMLIFGMVTEALVFAISAFDEDQAGINSNEQVTQGGGVQGVVSVGGTQGATVVNSDKGSESLAASTKGVQQGGGTGGSVVVIGGGSTSSDPQGGGSNTVVQGGSSPATNGATIVGNQSAGGTTVGSVPDMDTFADSMKSLNDMSTTLLDSFKRMAGGVNGEPGLAENMQTLNQNITSLSDVYSSHLDSVKIQMDTIRYMNESLDRMKRIYDGSLTDSTLFQHETAKMTRQIEALNQVYARLLQAMTSNPNPPIR